MSDNPNVISRSPDGSYDGDLRVKQLFDQPSTTTMYVGRAVLGTVTSATLWTIKKITFDASGNPLSITWTGINAVWDNRATETYT